MKPALRRLNKFRGIRYLATGGAAALTEYLSFLLLYYVFDVSVVPANIISFLLSLIAGFTLHKLWVFGDIEQVRRTRSQAAAYGLIAVINITFSSFAIAFLVQYNAPGFIAKLILISVIAAWNYLLFQRIVFANKKRSGDGL